jgi:NADH:ubiquinone oxidoreductase subunit 4 (subunit M)
VPYLIMAVSAVAGVVLGAWYMLWAVERVFFGGSREPPRPGAGGHDHGHASHDHAQHHGGHGHGAHADDTDRCDLEWYEIAALAPLAVFVVWIGLAPATFLAPPAAVLRAATRGATTAFDDSMRALEADDSVPQPAHVADRLVGHDHAPSRQPRLLTSELTLDRP